MQSKATYVFYKFTKQEGKTTFNENPIGNWRVIKIKMPFNSIHSFVWQILSFNRFYEYRICNDANEIIAYARVMPKIFVFGFIPKKEKKSMHIGPCFTSEKYRGMGFYPYLLNYIINSNTEINNFYIFCNETNYASMRGILKAGFCELGKGFKNKLGIYKLFKNKY